jgi:hypothetical protein
MDNKLPETPFPLASDRGVKKAEIDKSKAHLLDCEISLQQEPRSLQCVSTSEHNPPTQQTYTRGTNPSDGISTRHTSAGASGFEGRKA